MIRRLFPLLALLALAACATTPAAPPSAKYRAADYHPLAVGNQWVYAGKMLGQSLEKTITIKGLKDGFFADDGNGLLKVDGEGLRDDKRYLLRDPIARGKSWTSIVSVASTEHYEVVDVGFTVNTAAGSFEDCVRVRGTNRIDSERSFRTEWTYAPRVGIVRIAVTAVAGGKEIPQGTLELKSFQLAP